MRSQAGKCCAANGIYAMPCILGSHLPGFNHHIHKKLEFFFLIFSGKSSNFWRLEEVALEFSTLNRKCNKLLLFSELEGWFLQSVLPATLKPGSSTMLVYTGFYWARFLGVGGKGGLGREEGKHSAQALAIHEKNVFCAREKFLLTCGSKVNTASVGGR